MYLIGACEFEIVKNWEINVHHYDAHCDNSTHNVKVSYAVNVYLCRSTQQRNSRDEAGNEFINQWDVNWKVIRGRIIDSYLAIRLMATGNVFIFRPPTK